MTARNSSLPCLLTVKEVAERLQVSTKTVRRWIAAGALSVHYIGRQLRVSEDDLLIFLARRRK